MSATDLDLPPTKTEIRRARVEEQALDAAKVRKEIAEAAIARDSKTARLRALRLAKEAADRDAVAALPPKFKAVRRKVVAR